VVVNYASNKSDADTVVASIQAAGWAGRSMARTARSIADYDALCDPIRVARAEKSGKQLGDPAKAAPALLAVIASEAPPAHLLLGSDALMLMRDKLSALAQELQAWEMVTRSTDG
jgi:hypothetical protein